MTEEQWRAIREQVEKILVRGSDAMVRRGANGEMKIYEVGLKLRAGKR